MSRGVDIGELHRRVAVADGHADSLMWNRDLNCASPRGHVDFPRLKEAGVKIQCFTVVTRGLPVIDGFSLFAWKNGWPRQARADEWSRCVFQLERLAHFCRESKGSASIAATSGQLEANLGAGKLSAVIGIEGGHALGGKVERVKELYERGVRFMGLSHLSNNELGGTSTPLFGNKPLTQLGRDVLDAMGEVGMVLDVAHASPSMLTELLAHPKARPFCSHAGVQGATPHWRNLPDAVCKGIADKGGVVGIIFAPQFLGGRTLGHVVRHIQHALQVMGEDGVAFGSDYDGMIPLPKGMRDVRDLPKLTEALLDAGIPVRVVEKVLGENYRRFFGETLGARPPFV
jgi:membrane dipeptidase